MAINMKTTVEIEPGLLRAAKRAALERDTSLRELIQRGLRRELEAGARPAAELRWVEASGAWPEELDLADREKMWEWIERGGGRK